MRMNQFWQQRSAFAAPAISTVAVGLATILITLVLGLLAPVPCCGFDDPEELTEEFHHSYPLASSGRVELKNINGSVAIKVWDRDVVQLDAVKRAYKAERLAEAEIRVEADRDAVRIKTRYPDLPDYWKNKDKRDRPASVDYTLSVPRNAHVGKVDAVNGDVKLEGCRGEVEASSVNGRLTAEKLTGKVKLSTVNGTLKAQQLVGEADLSTVNGTVEAEFDRLDQSKPITVSSINGAVSLTIASDASAQLSASTVNGRISNDFELPTRRGKFVGQNLDGKIGNGGPAIKLTTVNGKIAIRRASTGT